MTQRHQRGRHASWLTRIIDLELWRSVYI